MHNGRWPRHKSTTADSKNLTLQHATTQHVPQKNGWTLECMVMSAHPRPCKHLHRPRHYRTRNARHLETPDANCRNTTTHAATQSSYTFYYHAAALKLNPFAKGRRGGAAARGQQNARGTRWPRRCGRNHHGSRLENVPVPVVRKLPVPVFFPGQPWQAKLGQTGKEGQHWS